MLRGILCVLILVNWLSVGNVVHNHKQDINSWAADTPVAVFLLWPGFVAEHYLSPERAHE